jgi:subtilase family serine protease
MKTGIVVLSLVVGMALPAAASAKPYKHVCGPPAAHHVRCDADVVTDASGNPLVTSGPSGYGPPDLQSAYNLSSASSSAGGGETIAIVDAYDDPNAEADLGVYRSQFGLAPCTTANGCFRKVAQDGSSTFPHTHTGWAGEISLDVDMVSAICPNCHILLVEANSSNSTDLGQSVNTAAALGANEISNSYGGSENQKDLSYDSAYFNHPGVAITASTGDSGFGGFGGYPSTSPNVTAVGGTSLARDSSTTRGWTETAWSGAGSRCSKYEPTTSWQAANATISSICSNRAVADVSVVADPSTGVAVYDTFVYGGWLQFGGTSVGAPVIASIYALAGNASSLTAASYAYAHSSALNDVVSGSNDNGNACTSALCVAQPGWDGPTGLGTPNGTGAF